MKQSQLRTEFMVRRRQIPIKQERLSRDEKELIDLLAPFRRGVLVKVRPTARTVYPGLTAEVVRVHTASDSILVRCRFGRDERGRSILRYVPIEDLDTQPDQADVTQQMAG